MKTSQNWLKWIKLEHIRPNWIKMGQEVPEAGTETGAPARTEGKDLRLQQLFQLQKGTKVDLNEQKWIRMDQSRLWQDQMDRLFEY